MMDSGRRVAAPPTDLSFLAGRIGRDRPDPDLVRAPDPMNDRLPNSDARLARNSSLTVSRVADPPRRSYTGAASRLVSRWSRAMYEPLGHSPPPSRARGVLPGPRSEPRTGCPACGHPVDEASHAVRLHGDLFHARCVLYQPRNGRRSRD